MYCKAKVNNGSVVIYYGVGGIMRFPTGVKISKQKDKNKKYKDWDYKNHLVSSDVANSTNMNKSIKNWLKTADDIISEQLLADVKISADDLTKTLFNIKKGIVQIKTELFLENYQYFMTRKKEQLVGRKEKSDISFATYQTFKSTIEDYQTENNIALKISDTSNTDWLSTFHTWLSSKRPKEKLVNGEVYKFKTKGNLNIVSIGKRFEVLTSYFSYLLEKKLLDDDVFLRNYKKSEITISNKIKTTLTVDEIHQLYKYKFNDEVKENVKFIFLFSCLTGFRWKDIENFNKDFITEVKGSKVYQHVASKTKKRKGAIATIPLSKLALEILVKLNYNLKIYSNAYTNTVLHNLLIETKLFDNLTLAEDIDTGRHLKRHELITMHRGRDTFITNLINIVPIHELMSYTSHEKLSTLQKYIDHTREINPAYIEIFDKDE